MFGGTTSSPACRPIVKNGFITVWDTPGLGIDFNVDEASGRRYRRSAIRP